jgi:hypothetical protein
MKSAFKSRLRSGSIGNVGNFSFSSAGLAPDRIEFPIGLRRLLYRWKAGAIAGRARMLFDFRWHRLFS